MGIRISAEREIEDARTELALRQPHRNQFLDPLDPKIECSLGRLRLSGRLTEAEYDAGCQWRNIFRNWRLSIGAPAPFAAAIDYRNSDLVQDDSDSDSEFSDEQAEAIARAYRVGEGALMGISRRVFHAVNAIAVYDEPEGLGPMDSTVLAAKRGLSELAVMFGHANKAWGGASFLNLIPCSRQPLPLFEEKKQPPEHLFEPRQRGYSKIISGHGAKATD